VEVRGGLYRVRVKLPPSNLLLASDKAEAVAQALTAFTYHRALLEAYVKRKPEFRFSLEPVEVESYAPEAARLAAEAALKAGVGPMAAVPGALAQLALKAMQDCGARTGLVENGGEIALFSDRPLTIAVYAGKSPISGKIGLAVQPEETPLGVATSSATVGHAINFGEADAAVAVADTASLADAAAKAACNAVVGLPEEGIKNGLRKALEIPGVRGALIIYGRLLGAAGRLPKLVSLEGRLEEVLKASLRVRI
ncbi:MAG: UPF0280 family protein, partial [Candidatus Hecatellaceae archaeon]